MRRQTTTRKGGVAIVTPKVEHFIGGTWEPSSSGLVFETSDPANGEVLASVAEGGAEDVNRAVGAARQAFDGGEWAAMLPTLRARLLWKIGDLVEEHTDELAELETRDQGQPLGVAQAVS